MSIVGWRSRWKKFAATWNVEEEQEGFCSWWVCQVEGEGEGCVIDVSTWNGGSGSGVVHCWLAFPVEEVCCYLERGGGAGMVLLVAGVPAGSGMGTPGTEGVNWEGSVQGRRARWKGKVFQVERKVEYGYGRSFYRFTQIMAIRNNGSPRFRIRYKGFESVFPSGTSYSSCFCRARCRS